MATIKPGIVKVGDRWTIRVQMQRGGKIRDARRVVDGITLPEALDIQAAMRVELLNASPATPDNSPKTFKEYYPEWSDHLVRTGRMRATTAKIRSKVAATLLMPYFGDRALTAITRRDVREWMEWLPRQRTRKDTPYSREYMATAFRDLKALMNDARDLEGLRESPVAGMRFAAVGAPVKAKTSLTRDEVARLLIAAEDETYDVSCMIWVAATTGMRFGEITALTWEDVDFTEGVIHVNKSQVGGSVGAVKNGRSRIAPLHPAVRDRLLTLQSTQTQHFRGLVFPSSTGTYRYPAMLVTPLANCVNRARIDKVITPHSLRRSCNNIVRMELGDVAARAMIGHVHASGTERYSNVEAEELQSAQLRAFGNLR